MEKEQLIKKYEMYLSYIRKEKELAMQGAVDFSEIDPSFSQKIRAKVDRLNAKMEVAEQIIIDLRK